jgi:phosphoglycerol transferase MdoB-like AlkP superfamily enzyme
VRLTDLRTSYAERLRLAGALFLPVLALGAILRVVLYASFHDGPFRPTSLLLALAAGLVYDSFATSILLAPAALLLAGLRLRLLAKDSFRALLLGVFYSTLLFDAAVEYSFFEEFSARYNHIALDYLIYPTEVFTNIWESYDVPLVVGLSIALGSLGAFLVSRRMRGAEFEGLPWDARWRALAAVLALVCLSSAVYRVLPAEISQDRVTSEVAQNGPAQLVRAFLTSDLDFEAYYCTLPRQEARSRASAVLGFAMPSREELSLPVGEFALQKEIRPSAGGERPLDILIVLEESFGSSFVGVLGHPEKGCTPQFDRWSSEGLLLTHLVATGNRTVRGLEGVLCSFVPLPGDSIVKRTRQEEVACLARVLAGRGFETSFFYGGYGLFDHMKPFMSNNGYREFVEQSDYPDDAFKTAWGVADEYIFDALLERQVRAAAEGKPLFATLLSVSNHKPYDVPPGRTDRPAGEKSRIGAVAYSDWCIGRYLDAARAKGVLDHTVVLIVGDHGARVYGSEEIPVGSYRIPALFLAPESAWPGRGIKGQRIDKLCSQIDLAPTLLSLAGVSCSAPFFGQDLTADPDGPGRAFVHHDRDIGILTDDTLVVLGLRKSVYFYHRAGRDDDHLERVDPSRATMAMRDLELDATAVFQLADELYRGGRFTLP